MQRPAYPRLAHSKPPRKKANCNELLNLMVNRLNRLVISASTGLAPWTAVLVQ